MLASAFSADSSDLFLKAYQEFQTGEKLERQSKPREALARYRAVAVALAQVTKADPDWQPMIVKYRLKKTQENIARLEAEVARLPASVEPIEGELPAFETAPSSAEPVVTVRPPASGRQVPFRPAKDKERAPSVATSSTPVLAAADSPEADLRNLRRQLVAARSENQTLNERLLQKAAELQSALVENDRTKVTVVELRAQVAQAGEEREAMGRDGSSSAEIRAVYDKRIGEIVEELTKAQAERDVSEEENERLLAKLDQAAKYITDSDAIRSGLVKERGELAEARNTAVARTKKIKDNAAEIERVTAENKRIKTKLAELEKGTVERGEYERLVAEKDKLVGQLARAEKDAAKARDGAASSQEKDATIASLQSELNTVNDRLLEAQSQASQSEEQMLKLRKELDKTSGELAQLRLNPIPGREEKNLISENELLRGIILRQIREQAKRDEAKQRLADEIVSLKVKSDVITEQLNVLGAPVLQLTPDERSLFREPVALLNEPDAGTMEVTLAITKPDGDSPVKEPPAATGPETFPDDVRESIQRARKLFEAKNYDDAERIYLDVIVRVPNNYFALSNLGAVQIEGGKLAAAEVALKKAVEINPKDSFAFTNLGIVFSRQGRFEEAIGALRQAIAVNDKDSVAHNYLGVCFGQQEQRGEAEAELKKAIEIQPDYPDAHFNLAVLYATTQPPSMDLAKQHYDRATQLGAAPDTSLERLIQ